MGYKYFAFISYSRKDSRAASFFHRKIEHFRIPTKYVAPERLPRNRKFAKPVFRDRRDLETRQNSFSEDIKRALESSRYLLVICSPNSAGSEWVEAEISHFLKTHGDDLSLVVPVILTGVPGTGSSDSECLPPALRDEAVFSRNLPSMIPDAGEQEKDGWENGVIQALSYLLQVSRERIRASVDAERVRQTRINAAIGIVCTIVFAGLAFWAVRAKHEAEAARERTRNILSNLAGLNSTLCGKDSSFSLKAIEEYWKRIADQSPLIRQSIKSYRLELAEEASSEKIDATPGLCLRGPPDMYEPLERRLRLAQALLDECKIDESENIYLTFSCSEAERECKSEICFKLLEEHYANEVYAVRRLYAELGVALLGDNGKWHQGARLLSKLRMADLARDARQLGDARNYLRQSVVQFYEVARDLGRVNVPTPLDFLDLDDMKSFLASAKADRSTVWFRRQEYMSDRSRLIKKINAACHVCAELAALEQMERFYAEYKKPDPIARLTKDVEYHLPYACSESVPPCLLEIYLLAAKEEIDMLKTVCREMSDHLKTMGKLDAAARVADFTDNFQYLGRAISL